MPPAPSGPTIGPSLFPADRLTIDADYSPKAWRFPSSQISVHLTEHQHEPGAQLNSQHRESRSQTIGGDGSQLPGFQRSHRKHIIVANANAESSIRLAIEACGDGMLGIANELCDRSIEKEM